ncbi:hypothetical protein PENANT_c063G07500 [Penicillium antarcticum]|uniref:Uncharacterized protein n=1 Tax=Penicillium antarcticum TaxID=416450 RepID=A0A1V6PPY4_9EURO|nr:uncharacterized protein N7508_008360 [Penicillium antarcticum]KAJ5298111.1 hypothetical protein N7508_008360 [Penicillium antarcticum]OQD79069.1 hypothetical protein PENANT_c063G07500 [Penicillium antarcticum]
MAAIVALFATPSLVSGLFVCDDQDDYSPTKGEFVVHYTAARDSDVENEDHYADTWIRICKPNANADGWDNVDPIRGYCGTNKPTQIRADAAGLPHDFMITNGRGCEHSIFPPHNLEGTVLSYNNQYRFPQEDENCGKRDHGVNCRFTL